MRSSCLSESRESKVALDPILWAMKDAPTADINEWGTLVCLAETADEDGCNAFPSVKTIAKYAKINERTVQRALAAMKERKLIAEGDQRAAMYIPEHVRPTVYDLLIPHGWFRDVERINAFRVRLGRPPLTPIGRPSIAAAPPKKTRADKGKKKPPKEAPETGTADTARGGRLEVTPVENPSDQGGRLEVTSVENPEKGVTSSHRVTGSPEGGDLKSERGRLEVTQTSPPTLTTEPPHPSVGSTEAPAGEGGTDGQMSPQREIPRTEGVRFLQELGNEHPKLMITGKPLQDQGLVVDELFRRGWQDEVLWELLTRPLPQPLRKDVSAIIAKRLRDTMESPLPGPRRPWEGEPTPTPQQYTEGGNAVVARHYECDGNHGMCGRPVEAEGDRCRAHARDPQPAW